MSAPESGTTTLHALTAKIAELEIKLVNKGHTIRDKDAAFAVTETELGHLETDFHILRLNEGDWAEDLEWEKKKGKRLRDEKELAEHKVDGYKAEVGRLRSLLEEGRGDDSTCGGDSSVDHGGEYEDGDKK